MKRWFVKADFAGAEVRAPESIEEQDIWDTFQADQRPFTVVWMESEEEARRWYNNAAADFSKLRRLNQIQAEIHEAELEGDMVRLMSLEAEEAALEG